MVSIENKSRDERLLITLAQTGDHQAFEELFNYYQPKIYKYTYQLMGNREDALDFTQDTFMRAYLAFPQTSHDLRFRAWIYRIATNACLDELRHRRLIKWQSLYDQSENLSDPNYFMDYIPSRGNFEPLPIISSDRATDPEAAFLDKENYEEIQAILDRLYPKYRVSLILREYQNLSYDEIAEALNTTMASVKTLLFRAREEFRQVYAVTKRKPHLSNNAA